MSTIAFLSLLPKRKSPLLVFLSVTLALSLCLVNKSFSGINPKPPVSKKGTISTNDLQQVTITLKVVPNVMQYDKKEFTVKAGQKVTINFENPDFMKHNLVIVKPGTMDQVGAAADLLVADPNGEKLNYVPKLKEVIFSTKLLNPQEKIKVQFTVPTQPGDYPFICTFPGHWRIMNGIMKVTK